MMENTVKSEKGFTLIELMIVVAIIAILASVAYPAYTEHTRQARRADGQAALLQAANAMERYYTANYSYAGAALGAGGIFPAAVPLDGGTTYYNLTITNQTASTFTLNAAPVGAQTGDRCGTMTLDETGAKTAAEADCWN